MGFVEGLVVCVWDLLRGLLFLWDLCGFAAGFAAGLVVFVVGSLYSRKSL